MPLLLFDLDNTLLPRDAAFRSWAQDFLDEHRLPAGDLSWFTTIDGGGYVPRSTVLGAAKRRYGLDRSMDFLLAHYRRGINSHIHCPASHVEALNSARSAGWSLGIVSNGGTQAQSEKIRRAGLGALVDGWVISEEARCLKPDPQIFEIAAQRCGVSPTGDWATHTWMVGDHAPADIAGAELTGLRSVWLHHGRPWAELGYRPTLSAVGVPEAVGLILSARSAPGPRRAVVTPTRRPANPPNSLMNPNSPGSQNSPGTGLTQPPSGQSAPAHMQMPSSDPTGRRARLTRFAAAPPSTAAPAATATASTAAAITTTTATGSATATSA